MGLAIYPKQRPVAGHKAVWTPVKKFEDVGEKVKIGQAELRG